MKANPWLSRESLLGVLCDFARSGRDNRVCRETPSRVLRKYGDFGNDRPCRMLKGSQEEKHPGHPRREARRYKAVLRQHTQKPTWSRRLSFRRCSNGKPVSGPDTLTPFVEGCPKRLRTVRSGQDLKSRVRGVSGRRLVRRWRAPLHSGQSVKELGEANIGVGGYSHVGAV